MDFKKRMKTALAALAMCLSCATVFAQIRVSGTVQDPEGNPVTGAAVMVVGTSNGMIADIDGNFELANVAGDASIEVSFLGYATQVVAVNNRSQILVVLHEDAAQLDEVVVVGYGLTKKRDLIASVSTVEKETMAQLPTTNLVQGLAGRSPGMIVTASGGGIDATPNISIRGGGAPIYVIDGVIRSAEDFKVLNSEDVESISILKDASAAAIYGSRAANGIVQVQTKRGESGKMNIDYDFNASFAQPSLWPEKLDSWTRAEYANIAAANDGLEAPFSAEDIQMMRDGSEPMAHNNTDWRRLVTRNWAPMQKHNIRLTGGNDVHRFYASLGYIDQNSLYKSNNLWMKRTTFRLSESANFKAIGLEVKATVDGHITDKSSPYTSTASGYYQIFSHINDKSPLYPGVNLYGLPYNGVNDNPVAETAADAGYSNSNNNVVNGYGELIWSLPWVEGLRLRAASNHRYYFEISKAWKKDAATYTWDSTEAINGSAPELTRSADNGYSFTNQAFADYNKTFGKHTVSLLAGFEQSQTRYNTLWAQRRNYQFDIPQMDRGDANTKDNGGWDGVVSEGRAAWIFSGKYNFASKYYAEVNVRRDGSDYFAPGKRWGTFYSGSLGWVVTEEKFMKDLVDRNILNLLKVRASYGETGQISSGRYAYLMSYNYNSSGYVVDDAFVGGFSEASRLPSPDLTWYTSRQTDFGFDFASLNNRLYGSLDYFYFSTKGYLVAPTGDSYLNQMIGVSMPLVKSDTELRRAGWEFQLGWRDTVGAFKYDISANYTYYNSLWAAIDDESEASRMNPYKRSAQRLFTTYDLMYHNLGYYQSADDVFNSAGSPSAYNTGNLTAGDIRYQDTNGDGLLSDEDYRYLGRDGSPHSQFGINTSFEYKGFYLNMLFQGALGVDRYVRYDTGQRSNLVVAFEHETDLWRPDNRGAQYPRLMSPGGNNAANNTYYSDFWLVNGSYLRMKDFSIGYNFKDSVLRQVKWLAKLRVGISGQNIFTLSKLNKYGVDPEAADVNNYSYPLERVIAFNVSMGF